MIALLFISIALFAYVSLHTRLIHSGYKLETRMLHQEAARTKMAEQIASERQKQAAAGGGLAAEAQNTSTLMSMDPKEGNVSLILPDPTDGGFKLVKPENGLTPYYDSTYKPFMPYYNSGYIPFAAYYNPIVLGGGANGQPQVLGQASADVTPIGSGPEAAAMIRVEETWTDRNGQQSIVLETAVAPLFQGW